MNSQLMCYCRQCRSELTTIDDLALIQQANGGFHLIITSETSKDVTWYLDEALKNNKEVSMAGIACFECKHSIGQQIRFANLLKREYLLTLDKEFVAIHKDHLQQKYSRKKKWIQIVESTKLNIRIWDSRSNDGELSIVNNNQEKYYRKTITPDVPSIDNIQNRLKLKPRDYQVESLYEAVKTNIILVLPTGMGKTLVSVMLMNEMYMANHFKQPDYILNNNNNNNNNNLDVNNNNDNNVNNNNNSDNNNNHLDVNNNNNDNNNNNESDNESKLYQVYEKRMIIFLVTVKPLAKQQTKQILKYNPDFKVQSFVGESSARFEEALGKNGERPDVIICTVDCLINWMGVNAVSLKDFYLIIFDEVHHATGEHSYVKVMREYVKLEYDYRPKILGLSASLSSNGKDMTMIERDIFDLESVMSARVFRPPSVNDVVKNIRPVECIEYTLSDQEVKVKELIVKEMQDALEIALKETEYQNKKLVYREGKQSFYAGLIEFSNYQYSSNKYSSISPSCFIRLYEMIESVGVSGVAKIVRLINDDLNSNNSAMELLIQQQQPVQQSQLQQSNQQPDQQPVQQNQLQQQQNQSYPFSNPLYHKILRSIIEQIPGEPQLMSSKYKTLADFIRKTINNNSDVDKFRGIIFVKTRQTSRVLIKMLKKEDFNAKIKAKLFVGHGGVDGMESEKQERIMIKFAQGLSKLLIATSVLEEGIDVKDCNMVICFDNDLNLRNMIQRRGRARSESGRFLYFRTPGESHTAMDLEERERLMNLVVENIMIKREKKESRNQFLGEWRTAAANYEVPLATNQYQLLFHNFCPNLKKLVDPRGHVKSFRSKDPRKFMQKTLPISKSFGETSSIVDELKMFLSLDFKNSTKEKVKKKDKEDEEDESEEDEEEEEEVIQDQLYWWVKVTLENEMNLSKKKMDNQELELNVERQSYSLVNHFKSLSLTGKNRFVNNENNDKDDYLIYFHNPSIIGGNFSTPTSFQPNQRVQGGCSIKYDFMERKLSLVHSFERIQYDIYHEDIENTLLYDIVLKCFYIILKRPPIGVEIEFRQDDEVKIKKRLMAPLDSKELAPILDCFALQITFDQKEFKQEDIKEPFELFIQRVMKIPLYYCSVHVQQYDHELVQEQEELNRKFIYKLVNSDKDIGYLMAVLNSTRSFGKTSIPMEFYQKVQGFMDKGDKYHAMNTIFRGIDCPAFTLPSISKPDQMEDKIRLQVKSPPENYVYIKKVFVTPTRTIFQKPLMSQENRVLRKYGYDRFLLVQFVEENLDEFIDYEKLIQGGIETYLKEGVFIAGYGTFKFMGNSASQARRKSSWFYCGGDVVIDQNLINNLSVELESITDLHQIRNDMVDFKINQFTNTRKYLRCLGLVFSGTTPTIEFREDQFHEMVPDIITNVDKVEHNFTEGIGYIGSKTAQEIIRKCGYPLNTSSFQIRIGGNKGVVSIHHKLEEGIYLRKSMGKFKTRPSKANRTLEIISIASKKNCTLNRQIINLFSGLGVPDPYFITLQLKYLERLALLLQSSDQARDYLKQISFFDNSRMTDRDILYDPLIRRVLHTIYQKLLTGYREKCFIPVEKARTLLGVIDETRLLQKDQAYLRITQDDGKIQVITGKVAVCKNPCLHPGDVRIVECVDQPLLSNMLDVIVFSSNGLIPTFKQCSGSDLDGDRYFVCFDPEVVNYIKVEKPYIGEEGGVEATPNEINSNTLIEQYMQNISKGSLGRIALAHLAICDKFDPLNGLAIELAIQHYIEVDVVKTGISGKIPEEAKTATNRFTEYPDFMEKDVPHKKYWQSNKVLGKLYRMCNSLVDIGQYLPSAEVDQTMLRDGFEKYLPMARKTFMRYQKEVNWLLLRHDIISEEEVISRYIESSLSGSSYNNSYIEEVYQQYVTIQARYKDEFLQEFLKRDLKSPVVDTNEMISKYRKEISLKASAWYSASFGNDTNEKLLSFYWIIREFVMDLEVETFNKHYLSQSIFHHFDNNQGSLFANYTSRQQISRTLLNVLTKYDQSGDFKDAKIHMFGSSSLFLFDAVKSDLDLFLHVPALQKNNQTKEEYEKERDRLFKNVEEIFRHGCGDQVDIENVEYIANTEVPIIRFTCNKIDCDLSVDPNGFEKTLYIAEYMESNPVLLPILYTIICWGRESGLLIHQADTRKSRNLKTWSLIWMVIHFCIETKLVTPVASNGDRHKEEGAENMSIDWWNRIITRARESTFDKQHDISIHLLNFYNFYTKELFTLVGEKNYELRCPLDSPNKYSLDLKPATPNYSFIQETFQIAYHLLSTMKTIPDFLSHCIHKNTKVINLDSLLILRIKGEEELYQNEWKLKTGADSISIQNIGHGRYQAVIKGDPVTIQATIEEIMAMSRNLSNVPILSRKSFVTGGGTTLLLEGSNDKTDMVVFARSTKKVNVHHMGRRPLSPILKSPSIPKVNWLDDAYSEYTHIIHQQLERYFIFGKELNYPITNCIVRFGHIYMFHAPYSDFQQTIEDTRKGMSKGSKERVRLDSKTGLVQIREVKKKKEKEKKTDDEKKKKDNEEEEVEVVVEEPKQMSNEDISMREKSRGGDVKEKEPVEKQKEKVPKSSFFPSTISNQAIVEEMLLKNGWRFDPDDDDTEDYYSLSLSTGGATSTANTKYVKDYKVIVNHDFTTNTLQDSNLYWFGADLKSLNDKLYDVRFRIESRKPYNPIKVGDIQAASSIKQSLIESDLLASELLIIKQYNNATGNSGQENLSTRYIVHSSLKDRLLVLRVHKNCKVYRPAETNPLYYLNLKVRLIDIVEAHGNGNVYATKTELEISLDMPPSRDHVVKFVEHLWKEGITMLGLLNHLKQTLENN